MCPGLPHGPQPPASDVSLLQPEPCPQPPPKGASSSPAAFILYLAFVTEQWCEPGCARLRLAGDSRQHGLGGVTRTLGVRRAAQSGILGVGAAAGPIPKRCLSRCCQMLTGALWLPWDRRVLDSFAGQSVLYVHPSRGAFTPKAKSPESLVLVFAGRQLYDNAERKYCDGCSHCQRTPDDQLLSDHDGGRRGCGRRCFLGLQLVRRSLYPGDAGEHDAVLRIHSRCKRTGQRRWGLLGGLRCFLRGFCLRSESTLRAAQSMEMSSPQWSFGGTW